jgi:hypothetical protein
MISPGYWRFFLQDSVHIQRRSKLAHSKSFAFDYAALAKTPALPVANRWTASEARAHMASCYLPFRRDRIEDAGRL